MTDSDSAPPAKRARPAGLDARVSSLAFPTLSKICSLAVDSDGTVFVGTESALYAISAIGRLALLAGSEHEKGFRDGQGSNARFNIPRDLAVEADGSLLVADTYNHCLRRVSPHGTVTTLAGCPKEAGFADGVGAAARFYRPRGIAVDRDGIIYVTDHVNHCIRRVTPENGTVSTLCGSREGQEGYSDGDGADARFWFPTGIALDNAGDLIVADYGNHCIRKVRVFDGHVSTVAGSSSGGDAAKGFADGLGTSARFHNPSAVAVDGNNAILVTDRENHKLRMIAGDDSRVTTLAGTEEGKVDGEGVSARFDEPWALAVDECGRLLVAELGNLGCVRVVEAALAPTPRLAAEPPAPDTLKEDYHRLLKDTILSDVTLAVEGQRFPVHRCVLAARSGYFKGLFESGRGMKEEGSRAAGEDIVLEEVSAEAFEVLLRFLYAQELPDGGEKGEKLGEYARVADRFQAAGLYEHCVGRFRSGLRVSNVVERLVQAHDNGQEELEAAAMTFFKSNAREFQSEAMASLAVLRQRSGLCV